jgi:hypothetical protein
LSQNAIQNLVLLKYLRLYADTIQYNYLEDNGDTGILLAYPTSVASWDSRYYPQSEFVLMPVASSQTMAAKLAKYTSETYFNGTPLVIKFGQTHTRDVFSSHFELQPAKVFLTYSTRQSINATANGDVVISDRLDDKCAMLYIENGHNQTELNKYFSNGATTFTIYDSDEPISTCFIFHNFGTIWEIGGVHTVDRARNQGKGRVVVQTAVNTLLNIGRIPRYQTDAENLPSIRLAESIGLIPYLRFEHYLAISVQ